MADNKEYISTTSDDGSVNISAEVVGIIALEAMGEVEGFGGTFNTLGKDIADLIGIKGVSRGIRMTAADDGIIIDTFVMVKYGYAVADVAKQIQKAVSKAVTDMTGAKVAAVNVNVSGVTFAK